MSEKIEAQPGEYALVVQIRKALAGDNEPLKRALLHALRPELLEAAEHSRAMKSERDAIRRDFTALCGILARVVAESDAKAKASAKEAL